jgi:hypothetical protein
MVFGMLNLRSPLPEYIKKLLMCMKVGVKNPKITPTLELQVSLFQLRQGFPQRLCVLWPSLEAKGKSNKPIHILFVLKKSQFLKIVKRLINIGGQI